MLAVLRTLLVASVLSALPALADSPRIALVGLFLNKAVLVIDGGPPRTIAVGQTTAEGIRLVETAPDSGTALVEIEGQRQRLVLGQSPVNVPRAPDSELITLYADARGHHVVLGSINDTPMRLLVDTGASMVSIGRSDAMRAGIDFRRGKPVQVQTASGSVGAWQVQLTSLRIGNVTLHGVDAIVFENDLPLVLLGMSFLNRMDMQREGDRLILRRKY